MEKGEDEQQLELPPGFRFYPSDEELLTHYLAPKVSDSSFLCLAIGEADLNKCEPWDLPWKAKMGEKEWYFFSLKDRKYPTGLRTNRATDSGYWKATGKDKEIYKMKTVVGMKKTLVFYRGRAPKGEKTNWVMHEFRLDSNYSTKNFPKANNNEWVISRVFDKCSGGKKTHLAANGKTISPHPPPLMDPSPNQSGTEEDGSHVTGFSTPLETQSQKTKEELAVDSHSVIQIQLPPSLSNSFTPVSQRFPETPLLDYTCATQFSTHLQPGSLVMQNQASILRNMLESRKWNNNWTLKTEPQQAAGISGNTNNNSQPNGQTFHEMPVMSQGDYSAAAGQSSDLDSVWNYFMQ